MTDASGTVVPMRRRVRSCPQPWLSNETVIFPVAAVLSATVALLTGQVTGVLLGLLVVALVPWGLMAAGVRVPHVAMTVGVVVPSVWAILHSSNVGPEFNLLLLVVWLTSRSGAVVLPLATSVAGTAASFEVDQRTADLHMHMRSWVLFAAGMAFAWFAGSLLRRERRLVDELEQADTLLGEAAVAEERRRIAREIHDIVGHSLTVVLLNVAGARRLVRVDPDAAVDALTQAEQLGRESLDQMREAVGLLRGGERPGATTDPIDARRPLPSAGDLQALVEQAQAAGVAVTLEVDGPVGELDRATGLNVYRVVQEALTNAGRHAPGAPVAVRVGADERGVHVEVANGRATGAVPPVPTSGAGTGLLGMRERVTAAGGEWHAGPEPAGGWRVTAELPRRTGAATEVTA